MKIREFYKIKPSFIGSFPTADGLPKARIPEVAFIGRSNVGKSSLINAAFNAPGLAKTSSTPGRTQTLNLFDMGGKLAIADLPGYGFAKAPKKTVEAWNVNVREYFATRVQLRRAFVLVDARVGLKPSDLDMMGLLDELGVPYQIALTKTDKVKSLPPLEVGARPAMLAGTIATSSSMGAGLDELRREIFNLAFNI
jgi:GTP-binding protein